MNPAEREALREAVTSVCAGIESSGWHGDVWLGLESIGVRAVSVPEALGGGGAEDLTAAAVVLKALGAAAASVPFVETDLVAGFALERVERRLPPGVVTAALAPDLEIVEHSGGVTVSGTVPRVPWGRQSDRVAVLATGTQPRLLLVPVDASTLRHGENVAGEPRDDLELSSVSVPNDDALSLAGDDIDHALLRGAWGRAALVSGAANRVLEETIRYASERQQFGRALSAMPVVQHAIAEMAAEVCAVTVAVDAAAHELAWDPDRLWPLAAAHARAATAAKKVAAIGHQVHGAMGFTREHPLHRATTRLWAWRDEYRPVVAAMLESVAAERNGLWQTLAR